MKSLCLAIVAVLVCVLPTRAEENETHLFILSGQSNMAGLDPEISFTPAVEAAFGKENVTVVKDAVGGQPIRRWHKDWKPPQGDSPKATGDLYDRLMKQVHAVVQAREYTTVTFVWMQGERDAKEKFGDVYAASLKGLIGQLEQDLGRDDVNFVIGRLSDFDMANAKYPHWTKVREVQVEVAEADPRGAWVDTDDLNDGVNKRGKEITNDLHYSVEGYRTLGKRFAEKAIALIEENRQAAEAKVFNINDFGAVGDGKSVNTRAIQAAVDACSNAGGGVVRVPSGDYVTGTIALKSHIILSVDQGASLLGSQDMKDYPTASLRPAREGNSECLLYAEDATDIRLIGKGVIDGRGKPEFFPRNAGPNNRDRRPRLIRFENCQKVTLSDLTFKNPAFWGIHLVDCRDVQIDSITIRFRNNHSNNDGIDLDGCENVLIENCDINAGDDAICLKSSLNPCRKIVVRNCKVSSNTAALKFGTSSSGGFIDVDVSNCTFYDCPMGAIKLQIVDGGRMENIKISQIQMTDVGCPLFIRLGDRGREYTRNTATGPNTGSGESEGARVGSIKDITIRDVVAKVTFEDRARAAHATYRAAKPPTSSELTDNEKAKAGPIMITGIPGHYVENVLLENIKISFPGQGTEEEANHEVPEDIARYPEQFFFGVLPAWGAYIRHARNVQFKNVELTSRAPDAREKIVLDDVINFEE
ncbi:sialate O-acetylesterase [Aporhodopirellula aestuarii]|uniref:Glycosyl hydrolase family 28 protein n=1 Tax=Aporhodopirellula aestuarii TaxID=2950107 RepID=A0ABT0UE01_9BACT|nr:sialate O-acetylesterase [Aporhodopirellula aestuarii]MCM2375061.1 glycosyl hydrolase family 28 protein [Aporhodopirellula aestuarii]